MKRYILFKFQLYNILLLIYVVFVLFISQVLSLGEVIWAVNCGGDVHTDINGITYQKDPSRVGIASDYGKSMMIQRVVPNDQILYQTERYNTNNFAYELSLHREGDYVLVLKFCEVWFTQPNQKVFDVVLNQHHTVVDGLDIYAKVGRGVAHDEIIPFSYKKGLLTVNHESSPLSDKLSIEFIKLDKDNPKVNAIYVMYGTVEDVPQLPPLPWMEKKERHDEEEEVVAEEDDANKKPKRRFVVTETKVQDPYAADETGSMMLPVFIAIGSFVPLLFCLCKL